jgi:hypothetical protein
MVTLTARGVPVGHYLKNTRGFPDDSVTERYPMVKPHAACAIRTV